MRIDAMLHEEIKSEMEALKDLEIGSDEYKAAVDGIAKLYDRAIEIDKIDIEQEEKIKNREIDTNLRLQQMAEERKDRTAKNILAAAGIIGPALLTIWGTIKSFEFEKEGTITTIMGRGFVNRLFGKK